MKNTCFLLFSLFLFSLQPLFSQCGSGTCPAGAITTLPAGGIIGVGTTYCISGTVNNSTAYTINGTLIIQSGSVTVGDLTVGKTGSIIINGGGQLMANSYTGDATAPAAVISNVTVCTNGYLYLSGAINPGETNFTLNDYGMFVIHGSWSTIIGDTWFNLGMGSIVEMCSSFTFKSATGFFTETSTGPSYVVTRSAMANGAGTGYLSKSGAASNIMWAIPGGPVAWVTHPAANTCTGPSCPSVLPPGSVDNGLCGSVINSFQMTTLPLWTVDAEEMLSGEYIFITAQLDDSLPAERLILETAPDGVHFIPTSYRALPDGDSHYRFTLPAVAAGNYYLVRAIRDQETVYSKILPPITDNWPAYPGQVRVFPDPAVSFVNIYIPPDKEFTSATLINGTGQILKTVPLFAGKPLIHLDLPAGLPTGIYLIRLAGMNSAPLVVRIFKL